MHDKQLYTQILGIRSPWRVADVQLSTTQGKVTVFVEPTPGSKQHCPSCGAQCPGYDHRRRQWRHLDTCQFKTVLIADVPRLKCPNDGVIMVDVPWAESGSGFTAMFEALVIDWLKEASIKAVADLMGLSWNAIDGIGRRAVQRGLARRKAAQVPHLCVDETAFKKRHDYVTIVSDQQNGTVLFVGDDRKKENLKNWYSSLEEAQLKAIQSVSMDMWPAFINATLESVPDAKDKVAFDKFHVAKYLGGAVDSVRRQEHKHLLANGRDDLKASKFQWLKNPKNMTLAQKRNFSALRHSSLRTARAWAIKEFAMSLWDYVSMTWAKKGWDRWYGWAIRSRLEPVKKVAKTIKTHLWGILNAVILKVSNGPAESINSRIRMIKIRSRGFRNKQRFANAIYFHLGGLDLYPTGVSR